MLKYDMVMVDLERNIWYMVIDYWQGKKNASSFRSFSSLFGLFISVYEESITKWRYLVVFRKFA